MSHSLSVRARVKPSRCKRCDGTGQGEDGKCWTCDGAGHLIFLQEPDYPDEPEPAVTEVKAVVLGLPEPPLPFDPREPTDARPGSPLKVRVLAERRRLGLPLFHPRDRAWPHYQSDGKEGVATGTRKPGKVYTNGKRRKAS
jgi:hypothetical protein